MRSGTGSSPPPARRRGVPARGAPRDSRGTCPPPSAGSTAPAPRRIRCTAPRSGPPPRKSGRKAPSNTRLSGRICPETPRTARRIFLLRSCVPLLSKDCCVLLRRSDSSTTALRAAVPSPLQGTRRQGAAPQTGCCSAVPTLSPSPAAMVPSPLQGEFGRLRLPQRRPAGGVSKAEGCAVQGQCYCSLLDADSPPKAALRAPQVPEPSL